MSIASKLALADHLATTQPVEGQSHNDYLAEAFNRWPDLTNDERRWAMKAAAARLNEEGNQRKAEGEALVRSARFALLLPFDPTSSIRRACSLVLRRSTSLVGFQGFVFELNVTRSLVRRIPPHQRPVRLPEKIYAEIRARKPAANIAIVVSSVYIRYGMPDGYTSATLPARVLSGTDGLAARVS